MKFQGKLKYPYATESKYFNIKVIVLFSFSKFFKILHCKAKDRFRKLEDEKETTQSEIYTSVANPVLRAGT